MDMKRFFLFAIVIAALTLAGCGGNGGGRMDTATPTPTPTPDTTVTCPDGSTAATMDACPAGSTSEEMALQDAKDAAMMAASAAMAAVGGAVDPVASGKAYNYAKMAQEANESAQAAMTLAMAEEYQMAAETARMKAMEAAGTTSLGLIMLSNKPLNDEDIENAELDGTDVPKAVSNRKNVGTAIADAAAGEAATEVSLGWFYQPGRKQRR